MKPVKKLLLNTLILTGASLLMRTIGMSFSVYLSNKIGSAGIGLYELIMSVYTLAVSFAASGVRLSTTRLVVDNLSHKKLGARDVMRVCIRYGLTLGTVAGALLFFLADFISAKWLASPDTAICLRILSFGLPFLSLSSCLNGYFTAVRRAGNFAFVQIAEQLIKIGITMYLLGWFLPLGPALACVALVVGGCLAEVLSTLLSYAMYRRETRGQRPAANRPPLLRRLLSIAIPDAVGSWVRSSLVTAKNLLIPVGLKKTGASSQAALATYGTVHGMVLPIITFPSAFLSALSSLLVPEVAESVTLNQPNRIRYIMNRVLHMTLLFSVAVAGALYCFAIPLGEAIYPGKGTHEFIRLLAPVIPIMYLDMTVDGLLKGMGLQLSSMKYNIIDAAMSLSLVWRLVPRLGIWGYIFTIYASEILNFVLSIGKLARVTRLRLQPLKSLGKPLISILAAGMAARPLTQAAAALTHTAAGGLIVSISLCLGFYVLLLVLFGSITREEIRWMKGIFRK